MLHLYGESVIPSAVYSVEALVCGDGVAAPAAPLLIETAKWGDIVEPFHGQGPAAQPDFKDIATVVATFVEAANNPGKARSQLQPNVPDPTTFVDFKDVSDAVDAFVGLPYPYSGPTNCP